MAKSNGCIFDDDRGMMALAHADRSVNPARVDAPDPPVAGLQRGDYRLLHLDLTEFAVWRQCFTSGCSSGLEVQAARPNRARAMQQCLE